MPAAGHVGLDRHARQAQLVLEHGPGGGGHARVSHVPVTFSTTPRPKRADRQGPAQMIVAAQHDRACPRPGPVRPGRRAADLRRWACRWAAPRTAAGRRCPRAQQLVRPRQRPLIEQQRAGGHAVIGHAPAAEHGSSGNPRSAATCRSAAGSAGSFSAIQQDPQRRVDRPKRDCRRSKRPSPPRSARCHHSNCGPVRGSCQLIKG